MISITKTKDKQTLENYRKTTNTNCVINLHEYIKRLDLFLLYIKKQK